MGNVIPWSEIHPSIKSEEPFVAVVIVDPQREICISELVPFDEQSMRSPEVAAQEMIGAIQAAAARVASGYRARRNEEGRLRVLPGGIKRRPRTMNQHRRPLMVLSPPE
ncbi:MAG TPA: hypothetical protein VGR77_09555 [Candidatus Dormibacteraeota bacterium]|nr:hypothetical protein [Candidatus Dormibacteraeota bacterium]